jgi:hypothetical protein
LEDLAGSLAPGRHAANGTTKVRSKNRTIVVEEIDNRAGMVKDSKQLDAVLGKNLELTVIGWRRAFFGLVTKIAHSAE